MIGQLCFHPLVLSDREAIQAVTLHAGRRNCNYTFANLLGWQFWYKTEACVLQDTVVLRYIYEGERAYSVCTAGYLTDELVDALLADSGGKLTIYALEDSQAQALSSFKAEVKPMRDLYDYIYRRTDLAMLQGGHLQAKRNHVNRFKADNPDFEYRGTRLNYDMLMSIMPELRSRYDFIFIPVMHRLKTHAYWQRWGATEFYRDSECVYYLLSKEHFH